MTVATVDMGTPLAMGKTKIRYQSLNGPTASVLSAHNINYTVKVSTHLGLVKTDKQILFNISGVFKKGLNAVLGPTGSGKSSFLDVLAGRKDPDGVSGQLLLDGKPVPKNFKCMVGYVVQDDVVMGTLSIRENFAFSAALRLPTSVKANERKEKIEQVIKELGLGRCADTKVGNEFIRGVSGGERKRCNIGMELIISPAVLFLDEPTTGLDAHTATIVVKFLKRLSRRGRTIIFSIHQPRYSIYRLFDSLMLLSQGHTVYHGPSEEALEFFTSQGYVCQEHNNPSDFFLDVINGDPTTFAANDMSVDEQVESDFENSQSEHGKLVAGFKNSVWYIRLHEEAGDILRNFEANGGVMGGRQEVLDYATPFGHQVLVLAKRALMNMSRNPHTNILTVGFSLFLAMLISVLYWQLGEDPGHAFTDRSGVLFLAIFKELFLNLTALQVFADERKNFMHENISGFYRVSVYFLVKVIFDILLLRLFPVIISSAIIYFAVGLNDGADHFYKFTLCLFCTTVTAAGLCFLISASVAVLTVGKLLLALCYIIMMLFSGFLINFDSIGPWLNWAQYLSFFKYALKAMYINEFKGRSFCANKTYCESGDAYLSKQDMDYKEPWDFWQNYVAMAVYTLCLLILTYIQLRRMKKTT